MSPPRGPSRAGALLAFAGTAAACAMPRPVAAQPLDHLRIGCVAVDSYAEPFYAEDAGFFRRARLSVALTPFNGSGAMAAAIAGNALDIGMSDVSVIANASARGLPFVVIAGGGLYSSKEPTTVLCVARSAPYHAAKDFEGGAIAVSTLVSLSSTGVKAWLARNGADLTKVRMVEMPPPQMAAALSRGTIAGAFITEPVLSQSGPEITRLANAYDAIGNRIALNNWFTTRDWLRRNPDAARRLVRCIYETARWANEHRSETAPILAKHAKLEPASMAGMHRALYATSLDLSTMQPVLDAAYAAKTIEHPTRAADIVESV